MKTLTRRNFLKASAAGIGTTILSARAWAQVVGANSDVRVAVVGLNGRGRNHLASLARIPGVRIVALCDVDTAVLDRVKASTVNGRQPYADAKTYVDLRDLLAAPDVDAITIATPNHWHALQAIWACQAGKDAYVEKPISHNVWEGRQLVAAAAKYQRVVQAGTQIRSGVGIREAVAWIQAGNLGKITAARGFCYKRRASIGRAGGEQPIPSTVNYDLWCGPAPREPLRRKQLHYDWHWVHATGNGDIGNQGIHQMDVARWFLGEAGLPRSTLSVGGRLGYVDDGETPNTQVIVHDYASAPLIFEVRGLPSKPGDFKVDPNLTGAEAAGAAAASMDKHRGVSIGNVIDCEGGYVAIANYSTATVHAPDGKLIKRFDGKDTHMENFIEVVRSRKTADLFGPVGEGHVSSALCHLGSISHVVGRATAADELREAIKANAPLAEACGRMLEHLAVNQVDYAQTPLVLGMPLTIDAKAERVVGAAGAAANAWLTRDYRGPYVVPNLASAV